MPGGLAQLGAALGGDSEQAYEEGRALGAKTEDALASARERVQKNAARAQLGSQLAAAGVPQTLADAAATSLTAGGGVDDPMDLMLKNQEFGFRANAGNPDVPLDIGQRNLLGVANGPVEPIYKAGGHILNKFQTPANLDDLGSVVDAGGGDAAGMQYARSLGLIDNAGHVVPGQEATFYDIIHPSGRVFDAGGVPQTTDFNPYRGGTRAPTAPGAPPAAPAPRPAAPLAATGDVAGNVATIAAAKSQAEATGKNAASLPTAINTLDTFSKDIDDLVASPGFNSIYGARVGTPVGQAVTTFASQDAADAAALRNKVNAESFRASINSMRGLGQLSNAEGEKVQAALTTLADPHLSPEAARVAAQQLKVHLAELKRVAQIEAGQGGAAPAATSAPAATGAEPTATSADGRKVVYRNGQWQPL